MQPSQFTYPVFEANQVLTNAHLNQVFNYLDDQERLTRANLIGIGIVCGLEMRFDSGSQTIHLSRGCGITSEGYLITEPDDVQLTRYRNYNLPTGLVVNNTDPEVDNPLTPYPLWELFPEGEPGTSTLGTTNFVNDKAVLLFLEVNKQGLRNCSPNNCDDKGAGVTTTVRRLLIRTTDLVKIIAKAGDLSEGSIAADIETVHFSKLKLPDLKIRRWNVPNTHPLTSKDVLMAFQAVIKNGTLVNALANALSNAYDAFKPLLQEVQASNPFTGFATTFGFLNTMPATAAQVRFLQYYVDFFDDLIQAYEEFRWKGAELLCACCPDVNLFPRHLMLGALIDPSVIYRQAFLSSPAASGCNKNEKELKMLFQRLVNMISCFTDSPPLLAPTAPVIKAVKATMDNQIRITPSLHGKVPLSEKAIPYYYLQTGNPALYELWNSEKSRRHRANQNPGYRAGDYQPAAPAFVTDPLRYDLEPYNFLRIEGHLGKNYQAVLSTLLSLKEQYRLPIDVVALRTGAFDENIAIDLSKETARFQDLETLYDAFREDLLRNLAEGVVYLYDVPLSDKLEPGGAPNHPLVKKYAPAYRYLKGSFGEWYETNLQHLQGIPYLDVDDKNIDDNTVMRTFCALFWGITPPPDTYRAHAVSVFFLTKLWEIVPDALDRLAFQDFENKYQDLIGLTRYFRTLEKKNFAKDLQKYMPQEELLDSFNEILFDCRLDAFKAIHDEYRRRLRDVKQKQFLSFFLRNHPGIQHKAGVPMGGTFILVYHDDPEAATNDGKRAAGLLQKDTLVDTGVKRKVVRSKQTLAGTLDKVRDSQAYKEDPDLRLIVDRFSDQLLIDETKNAVAAPDKIYNDTVDGLADGTVIADFFLPYRCGSDGPSIEFVLPLIPPTFTYQIGCTTDNNEADVTLLPAGGAEPYNYKVNNQNYQPYDGAFILAAGEHTITIKDAAGTESGQQKLTIPNGMLLANTVFVCAREGNVYTLEADITGGFSPYQVVSVKKDNEAIAPGKIEGSRYRHEALPGNTDIKIVIADNRNCSKEFRITHSCLQTLSFHVNVGCTAGEVAAVKMTPAGGQPPYQMRLDNATAFTDWVESVDLPVGDHTVVIKDAAGTSTEPQTFTVAPPLSVATQFSCEKKSGYKATISITGGIPPYTVVENEFTKEGTFTNQETFVTSQIPNDTKVRVEVQDKNGCRKPVELQFNCCDLPCKGASRRLDYRLWLQPVSGKVVYGEYSVKGQQIFFRYNDQQFELPSAVLAMPVELLNQDFDNVMAKCIEKLNGLIAKRIGKGLVNIQYNLNADMPFRTLQIEYFECEKFRLQFGFTYKLQVGQEPTPNQPVIKVDTLYDNEIIQADGKTSNGMVSTINDKNPAMVPAFNAFARNQCRETDFKPLCKERKWEPVIVQKDLENNNLKRFQLIGDVKNAAAEDMAAWIWEMPNDDPGSLFSGQESPITGRKSGADRKFRVRLTVIDQKGCFGSVETEIGL